MGRASRRRRHGPTRITFWAALLSAATVGLAGGLAVDTVYASGRPAHVPPPASAGPLAQAVATPSPATLLPTLEQPLNVLFMATDVSWEYRAGKRAPGLRGRTDTMMLARFDPQRGEARILSIPRDTRTAVAGYGNVKVNAANPYGGPALAVGTVSRLLDVPIDRYVLINTRAVIQLVDALGGVEIYVPKALKYDDWAGGLHIRLAKGPNKLNGQQAHDFLRFRHDDLGDLGRVQRQQLFMQAAVRQLLTPGNLLRVPSLLGLVQQNMETDLSTGELVRLATWGRGLDANRVQMAMVPGREGFIAGGWYLLPDPAGIRRLVDGFLLAGPVAEARAPGQVRVALRDGVGDRQALARLKKALAGAGYVWVEEAGRDAQLGQETTRIIAQNADEAGALDLAYALGVGEVVVASTGVLSSDVTIVMGKDWLARAEAPQASAP